MTEAIEIDTISRRHTREDQMMRSHPVGFTAFATLLGLLAWASPAWSMGLLMPNGTESGSLAIESHRVTIEVTDSAAVTHVDQVFRNDSNRQLEATFIFPLPRDATVSDFALYINGVRTQGEVLESSQARQVYNNIVRRVQDPGLVEYVDGRIFQASIFPVPANGSQRVELEFAQVLERRGDLRRLTYPLQTGRTAATTLSDFTLSAAIGSSAPLRTIYSPTHEIEVVRETEQQAIIGLEQANADLERDFVLYLSTSDEEVGVDLLTYDEDGSAGEDGYFLMVVAPRLEDEGEVPAKDVTFVVDTSGSMAGEKLEQAQETLRYCIGQLGEDDRFNVIRFSTASRGLFDGLMPASDENQDRAREFVDGFRATGGTAIEDALGRALGQRSESNRPHHIIFITDGLPTVGETDTQRLVDTVAERNQGDARLFTFGVGYDVDTQLLDEVALQNAAVSDYVRPGENMEMAVSALYDRIAFPVLTDISIDMAGVEAYDVFPQELSDLFAGQQVVISGRYERHTSAEVTLAGQFSGGSVTFSYDEDFDASEAHADPAANDFIPQLWATRKVGFLVDQIRLNGETSELRDEVMSLGVRYGLVTPYTSYLAVDDSEFATPPPVPRPGIEQDPRPTVPMRGTSGWGAEDRAVRAGSPQEQSEAFGETTAAAPMASGSGAFRLENSGRDAVAASEEAQRLQETEVADNRTPVRHISGRTVTLDADGVWRDSRSRENRAADRLTIRYLSDAYFRLVELRPDLARVMALGDRVEVGLNDDLVIVIDATTGLEALDDEAERRLSER